MLKTRTHCICPTCGGKHYQKRNVSRGVSPKMTIYEGREMRVSEVKTLEIKKRKQDREKSFKDRDARLIQIWLTEKYTLESLGREFNVTRERTRQILKCNGIIASDLWQAKKQIRIKAIQDWYAANPTTSWKDAPPELGKNFVQFAASYGIKRDAYLLRSATITQAKLNGRIELTEDFLRQEYLDKNKS